MTISSGTLVSTSLKPNHKLRSTEPTKAKLREPAYSQALKRFCRTHFGKRWSEEDGSWNSQKKLSEKGNVCVNCLT